ncbi:SPOR domain-containing protein [Sulfitobacter guttiformis]|uniref:Sporulation related protein n=1 Tax=Sulfitobacter guttiformis TaxID=74349 RepID=A0A420DQ37_9RHOB|nr:SPOR domain-containing protein [Sulfitobacter guttiformis]KIN73644.1 Sporulation domain protein [Sulfitobacter guttiformis KCTC 32187]RKE96290.1 sporulation related protein [Sulfitobacter guttiformis]
MKLTRLVVIAIISGTLGAAAASAQSRVDNQPAEFPPASFLGKQYVDSKGCVFIRAGIDGLVSWVPRISRSRQSICGFKPTFAGQVTQAPAAPVQTAEVVQITNPPAASAVRAPAPQPRPAPVVQARPKAQPAPKVVRQVARAPAPIVEKVVQPAPVMVPAPQVAQVQQGASACPGASAISGQYLRSGRYAVRCGPQTASIIGSRIPHTPAPRSAVVASVSKSAASQPVTVGPNTRIVPRHVAVNRVNTTNVTVPHGYKRVWEDGRLNPKRAEQSLAGHYAMNLVWTSSVPRRLINQADGRDVTASVPLVYPYTDYAAQQREFGEVTIVKRNGRTLKRLVRNVRGVVQPEPAQARVATVQRQPVYSSRSAPQTVAPKANAQPKAQVAGRGFVQVGAFTDPAAAQQMARKVQQMGMPVRIGRYTRDGLTTRLVIAGPFGGQGDVSRAVSRLRGAGYSAFAR